MPYKEWWLSYPSSLHPSIVGKQSFLSLSILLVKVTIIYQKIEIEPWEPLCLLFAYLPHSAPTGRCYWCYLTNIFGIQELLSICFSTVLMPASLYLSPLISKPPVSFYSIHCSHNQEFSYKPQSPCLKPIVHTNKSCDLNRKVCVLSGYVPNPEQNVQVTPKSPQPTFWPGLTPTRVSFTSLLQLPASPGSLCRPCPLTFETSSYAFVSTLVRNTHFQTHPSQANSLHSSLSGNSIMLQKVFFSFFLL